MEFNEAFEVAASKVAGAGLGLFARRPFKRGERLLTYRFVNGVSGPLVEALSRDEYLRRYRHVRPTHVFYEARLRTYWDGSRLGVGAKINSCPRGQNTRFDCAGNVVATRRIQAGDEVYVSYGPGFWRGSGPPLAAPAGGSVPEQPRSRRARACARAPGSLR